MQPEQAVLIPPSDEQAWPSFHVVAGLAGAFLDHLKARGIEIQLPPEDIGRPGPHDRRLIEIEVAEEHSQAELQHVLDDFLRKHQAAPH